MNQLKTTIKTRLAPLFVVMGLGILLSACGSEHGIETADSLQGLSKGSAVVPAGQSSSDASQVSFGQTSSVAQIDQTGVLQTQVTTAAATPGIDGSVPVSAAPAQSVVTSAPTTVVQAMGRVSLSWTPPTENTDGSALGNLAGYRVYFGSSPSALTQKVEVSAGLTAYVLENLPAGTTYFAIAAYNSAGGESALSGVGSKTI